MLPPAARRANLVPGSWSRRDAMGQKLTVDLRMDRNGRPDSPDFVDAL
jgi:hypothetical protein